MKNRELAGPRLHWLSRSLPGDRWKTLLQEYVLLWTAAGSVDTILS
jgi:hypothetical protein